MYIVIYNISARRQYAWRKLTRWCSFKKDDRKLRNRMKKIQPITGDKSNNLNIESNKD